MFYEYFSFYFGNIDEPPVIFNHTQGKRPNRRSQLAIRTLSMCNDRCAKVFHHAQMEVLGSSLRCCVVRFPKQSMDEVEIPSV